MNEDTTCYVAAGRYQNSNADIVGSYLTVSTILVSHVLKL